MDVPPDRTRWVGLLARAVLGVVWVVSGALKLPEPVTTVRAVRAYELLPEAVVPTVGYLLPVLETVLGVLLLAGLLVRGAAVVSAVLQVLFIAGIASVWARGISIDCGCFGGGGAVSDGAAQYPWDIARDAGLLLASAWLVWRPRTPWSLDPVLFPARGHDADGWDVEDDDEEPADAGLGPDGPGAPGRTTERL